MPEPDDVRETPNACEECGNDDPCEGYALCSDCLEGLTDA